MTFVRTRYGKTITIEVEESEKVGKLKELIFDKENIVPANQRLLFCGYEMEDERKISEYRLQRYEYGVHLQITPPFLALTVRHESVEPGTLLLRCTSMSGEDLLTVELKETLKYQDLIDAVEEGLTHYPSHRLELVLPHGELLQDATGKVSLAELLLGKSGFEDSLG